MKEALTSEVVVMFVFSVGAFFLAMCLTPIYTHFAYKYKLWKKQKTIAVTGEALTVMNELHKDKIARHLPTMAGVIGVVSIAAITFLFNFDRGQTWLPLAALLGGAIVGLIDDIINVFGNSKDVAGLRSSVKFTMITLVGVALGWFFFAKLGYDVVFIPFLGNIHFGWAIVAIFAFIVVATSNAVNISDGLDGLSGGLLIASFGAFAMIAMLQGNYGIAVFCFTVIGALLSYIWFNIFPARFMMGDIGSFAFGTALGVVAMLTNSLVLLPVIGFLFVLEAGSSLLQIISKKFFHKKIFISAPLHHHLEAKGWPETKVTMRFWVIAIVLASLGVGLALAGGIA
ncbi:MAG: phospho-N-acetylmuramoyl-pentapeptide-transferase [Candidatus Nomurabacteria bacterium]|jgi:phospho-N-acetylmuramoyl-pentapeptide-transferase|nr:phospho-N-acetylmuramoyl-pentapeptide-transferase [Candidatus Nomurabacteria bacterium]